MVFAAERRRPTADEVVDAASQRVAGAAQRESLDAGAVELGACGLDRVTVRRGRLAATGRVFGDHDDWRRPRRRAALGRATADHRRRLGRGTAVLAGAGGAISTLVSPTVTVVIAAVDGVEMCRSRRRHAIVAQLTMTPATHTAAVRPSHPRVRQCDQAITLAAIHHLHQHTHTMPVSK